jgi:uncharacterized protein YkwD
MRKLIALILLSFIATPNGRPATAADSDEIDLDNVAAGIIERTNDFRQQNELDPVSADADLNTAAKKFAEYMAQQEEYGHQADGRTPAARAEAAGYQYCVIRENIAYRTDPRLSGGEALAEFFTQGWIDSPHHRENMLADFITDTGVAVASTDGVTFYAVQMFGRPESATYTIRVANETETSKPLMIRSNGGKDKFSLPPRTEITMQRCFPAELAVGQATETVRVVQSASFEIVVDDKDEVVLKRVSVE